MKPRLPLYAGLLAVSAVLGAGDTVPKANRSRIEWRVTNEQESDPEESQAGVGFGGEGKLSPGKQVAKRSAEALPGRGLSMAPSPLRTSELRKTAAGTAYDFFRDVEFPAAEGVQLMDVYLPSARGRQPRPAALIIHGGGWAAFNKAHGREVEFATFMVDQGYAAVSINYTLVKYEGALFSSKKIKGAWPQNIADCKSALRWMKEHAAALGIDAERIAVMGASAGGHLALLTGLSAASAELNRHGGNTEQDNSVRCIVNFYGIPDVRRWGGGAFLDEPKEQNPGLWALASPVTHLSQDSPPILIVHGTADPTVDIALSEEFVAILREKNITYDYVIVKNGEHGFALRPPQQDLRPVVGNFLKRHLVRP